MTVSSSVMSTSKWLSVAIIFNMGAAAAIIFEWSLAREVTTRTLKAGRVVAIVGDGVALAHPPIANRAIEILQALMRVIGLPKGGKRSRHFRFPRTQSFGEKQ